MLIILYLKSSIAHVRMSAGGGLERERVVPTTQVANQNSRDRLRSHDIEPKRAAIRGEIMWWIVGGAALLLLATVILAVSSS